MLKSIFFHIPKAAGTSVKNGFYHAYSYPACLKVWPVAHGGDLEIASLPSYTPPESFPYECAMGHFNVTNFRVNQALTADFEQHGEFTLACIRDPFDRLLSDYNYILNTPTHDRLESVKKMTAVEYAEQHPANEQARWLDIKKVTPSGIEFGKADKLTDHMIIVLSDEVDRILPSLFKAYTERIIEIPRQNVGKQREQTQKPKPSEKFIEKNAVDYALVDFLRASGGMYIGAKVKPF